MTTKQILKRLDSLSTNVFQRHFNAKYAKVSELVPHDAVAATITKYSDAADGYVVLASRLLHTPGMLDYLAMCTDPMVVFVVYKRFEALTRYFGRYNPEKDWHISTTSSVFWLDLFIGEWHNTLAADGFFQ